nr:hypothetical protein [uncultured Carboxylicivirga sp.]
MMRRSLKQKRTILKIVLILIYIILVYGITEAQNQDNEKVTSVEKWISPAKTAINVCPGGIVFGFYSANIEHLIGKNHGIVLRGDLETIPGTYSDANIDANGKAIILNYRYHIGGGLNSFYAGTYGRYRKIKGEGMIDTDGFDFSLPEFTIGLNAGKRWIWKSGITLNFALGYGYSFDNLKVNNSSMEALDAIEVFRDEYTFMSGFLGELSIGYTF